MSNSQQSEVCIQKFRIQDTVITYPGLLLLATCCILIITGCGSKTIQTASSAQSKSMEYNLKGVKASGKGDLEKALAYHLEALKINRSIENIEGISADLISIAVIYQKKGDLKTAQVYINEVFTLSGVSDAMKSEAAFENARIFFKLNDLSKSREWVNRSLALNKGVRDGSRLNLLGRIAFMETKYDEALDTAQNALRINQSNKQRNEEANSIRLTAEIYMAKKSYSDARRYYLNALEIDKELGVSKKIALDLHGLGMLSLNEGNAQDAVSYFIREYEVSSAAEDIDGAVSALDSIADAYKKTGSNQKAEEILKKKAELEKLVKPAASENK